MKDDDVRMSKIDTVMSENAYILTYVLRTEKKSDLKSQKVAEGNSAIDIEQIFSKKSKQETNLKENKKVVEKKMKSEEAKKVEKKNAGLLREAVKVNANETIEDLFGKKRQNPTVSVASEMIDESQVEKKGDMEVEDEKKNETKEKKVKSKQDINENKTYSKQLEAILDQKVAQTYIVRVCS